MALLNLLDIYPSYAVYESLRVILGNTPLYRIGVRAYASWIFEDPVCRKLGCRESALPKPALIRPCTTTARLCILMQGVDNPDQAPLRPAPTLVTTRNSLPQIHATSATIHPCTGAYTVHMRPHTLRYRGYRARLRYWEFPRMSVSGNSMNKIPSLPS